MKTSMRQQRGAILIISLMFMVVLTMLALTTMGGITLEERMSGQYRDLNVAFQELKGEPVTTNFGPPRGAAPPPAPGGGPAPTAPPPPSGK